MLDYVAVALDIAGLSTTDKMLLIQLARRADRIGRVREVKVQELARACSTTDRTIQKSLAWLEDKGIVTIRRIANAPSNYCLSLSEMMAIGRVQ